jgi:pimeloyl-ACP methyl ester carboxylesterase/DNA-binding CsgD family transcriptional regulator
LSGNEHEIAASLNLHAAGDIKIMNAVRQRIQFCKSRDETRIALATIGKGPPIVRAAHWFSHLEFDARSSVWGHWLEELSREHAFIRYDQRGCGLSDWTLPSVSLDDWVEDLAAVVDALQLKRVSLFGMSQGAAVAIAYAERYPERISHLILLGAYARGRLHRELAPQHSDIAQTLVDVIRLGWTRDNPAYRQLFTTMLIPDGTREQQQCLNEIARLSTPQENAVTIRNALYRIDVVSQAQRLRVPTLVFHSRGDAFVEFNEGRYLASLIPSARFVPLDSRNHVLLKSEPAWQSFLVEVRAFLREGEEPRESTAMLEATDLTPSERQVLRFVARGLDNHAIAAALGKREKTVRNQVSSILSKLGVRTRAEAIVTARDGGIEG